MSSCVLCVLQIVVCDEAMLKQWYEPWALLRHQEMAAMLPNLAAGGYFSLLWNLVKLSVSCPYSYPLMIDKRIVSTVEIYF